MTNLQEIIFLSSQGGSHMALQDVSREDIPFVLYICKPVYLRK